MILVAAVFTLCALIHCLGDFFMKRASIAFTWTDLLLATVFYVITIPGWLWVLKMGKLATLASIGAAMQAVILVMVGVLMFNEHLTTREIIGIFFAIAALVMFAGH